MLPAPARVALRAQWLEVVEAAARLRRRAVVEALDLGRDGVAAAQPRRQLQVVPLEEAAEGRSAEKGEAKTRRRGGGGSRGDGGGQFVFGKCWRPPWFTWNAFCLCRPDRAFAHPRRS